MSRFPFPIPFGWFGLAYSHELHAGELRKVQFCGRDLVVFRTEEGEVGALNNYCPHLGAALHQGKVVGDSIQCAFHHWQYNTQGKCTGIPYAKQIPARAVTDIIPVVERNGIIMGWHHPHGEAPLFDFQTLDALNGDRAGWGDVHYFEFELPTCVQEIAENDCDSAHFPYVHGSPALPETETVLEGYLKRSVSMAHPSEDKVVGDAAAQQAMGFRMERFSHGPGSVTVHCTGVQGVAEGVVGEFILYNVATPIDDETTKLRWSLVVTENLNDDDMGRTMLEGFPQGVMEDIPIWQEKQYQPNPVLCDGDGPIAKHRKWFKQFYV